MTKDEKNITIAEAILIFFKKFYIKNKIYRAFINIYSKIGVTIAFIMLGSMNTVHTAIVWCFLLGIFIVIHLVILFLYLGFNHFQNKKKYTLAK